MDDATGAHAGASVVARPVRAAAALVQRLLRRLRSARRLRRHVGLWYHSAYAARELRASSRVPDVDPARGETVLSLLADEGLLRPGDVRASPSASAAELSLFHPPSYLEQTADPAVLGRVFGLDAGDVDVERLLTAQRRATGGTIAATRAALGGTRCCINLGGGFHHAERDRGSGFCVYNDIAVALAVARREGFAGRVAIVDLDFHQGNGNLLAFVDDDTVLNYSLHGAVWSHATSPGAVQIEVPAGTGDDGYLALLDQSLVPALARHRPDLVFYVAGNDVLAGDRLGTLALSVEGVLARDRRVVTAVQRLGVPLVVTLGGGYGPQAWWPTANLLRFVLCDDERPRPPGPTLRASFERIARELDPLELQRDPQAAAAPWLTEADFEDLFGAPSRRDRVLDFYSAQGIEFALERYGVLARVRDRGFDHFAFELDGRDPSRQMIRMRARKPGHPAPLLLVELVLARASRRLPVGDVIDGDAAGARVDVPLLSVEWLLLQDPTASFSLERPRLPGQTHPGLGVADEVQELLVQAARRLGFEGLLDRPAHFHNAWGAHRASRFLAPDDEGRFLAVADVMRDVPLVEASWLLDGAGLRLADGTPVRHEPAELLLPVSDRLHRHLSSPAYVAAATAARDRLVAAGLSLAAADPPVANRRG
jgi:acetoin utilization deacetylase AcuC-like enzyme